MPKKQPSLALGVPTPGVSAPGPSLPPPAPNQNAARRHEIVHVNDIAPNQFQPRLVFSEEYIAELSFSIAMSGLLQNPICRPGSAGTEGGKAWELIAGENRIRAVKLLMERGEHDGYVEIDVREVSDRDSLLIALTENLKRRDFDPLGRAWGFQQLVKMGLTQLEIGEQLGYSESTIGENLRLLDLPGMVKDALRDKLLSAGHGVALLPLPNQAEQVKWAVRAIDESWSVKKLETEVRAFNKAEHERLNPPVIEPVKELAKPSIEPPADSPPALTPQGESIKSDSTAPPAPDVEPSEEETPKPETQETETDPDTKAPQAPAPVKEAPTLEAAVLPASGGIVMAPVPASEAAWIKSKSLTTGVALAHLRRFYSICESAPNLSRVLEIDGMGGALDYLEKLHTGDN